MVGQVSYRSLVRFFKHIIALDRFTDPTYPILFSERLKKKTQRAQTSEVNEINTYMSYLNVCVRLTPAQ